MRDLIRARYSAMDDLRKARHRLKGFLLRLGFRYTGKSSWNEAHKRYLSRLIMPQAPQQIAFQEYIHGIDDASERLERLDAAVLDALPDWKWAPVVRALMSLRGVQELTAMTLVAEVGDFSRFEDPRSLMHFLGLTPSEHSSSDKRIQGGITKCGNAHCRRVLSEAAWQYRLKPKVSEAMQKRQENQGKEIRMIAWEAQQRLHKRFKQLSARKKGVVAATAVQGRDTYADWATLNNFLFLCGFLLSPDREIFEQFGIEARGNYRAFRLEFEPLFQAAVLPIPSLWVLFTQSIPFGLIQLDGIPQNMPRAYFCAYFLCSLTLAFRRRFPCASLDLRFHNLPCRLRISYCVRVQWHITSPSADLDLSEIAPITLPKSPHTPE